MASIVIYNQMIYIKNRKGLLMDFDFINLLIQKEKKRYRDLSKLFNLIFKIIHSIYFQSTCYISCCRNVALIVENSFWNKLNK